MKKSRIETADTRKRILATATRMFMENGLAETGIASIMSAAGLTQGGFYRHFSSKEQLIAEANGAANDRMFALFDAATSGKPAAEALDIVVGMYLDQLQDTGREVLCPLPSLGTELRRSDKLVRDTALTGYERLLRLFAELVGRTGAADPEGLAEAIVTTMVGAVLLARLAVGRDAGRNVLCNARRVIRSFLASSAPAGA